MIVLAFVMLFSGYVYEDSDSLIVDNDSLTICGYHQYAQLVQLRNNSELLVRAATGAPDSTGWLVFSAPVIFISDSSSIDGSARGYKGAYLNSHPWGYGPGGGSAGGVSGGAGGGGAYGGNGGAGGDIYGGVGGTAYGDSADTLIEMGSGGGAGRLSAVDGAGGNGAASISLRGTLVQLDSSSIFLYGQRGYDGSVEAGGGGAGGGVLIWSDTVRLLNVSIHACGGNGGDAAYGGGGGGGGGRAKVFYVSLLDTSAFICQISGGNPGIGDSLLPQSTAGSTGSFYIGAYTGIAELATQRLPALLVQPNPTQGIICVRVTDPPTEIEIYDCIGRNAGNIELAAEYQLVDLSGLTPGVYFLRSENYSEEARKLIIIE